MQQSVPRGPFRSSRDWIATRLSLREHECKSTLANAQDKDDLDGAQRTLDIVQRLQSILDDIFPEKASNPEPSMLHHGDLSQHNIMVDENGTLTGVLDWECVSAVPLWKACSYPSFLTGRDRPILPDLSRYNLDDPDTLYWEHLMDHELTLFRGYFIASMRHLQPQWVKVFQQGCLQRDFDSAVNNSDCEFAARGINEWIDAIAAGGKDDYRFLRMTLMYSQ